MPKVTLYTKPNCPLCDKALEQIERARQRVAFEFEQVNILGDFEIYERYKHDIPVVHLNGAEVARHRLSSEELLEKLRAM